MSRSVFRALLAALCLSVLWLGSCDTVHYDGDPGPGGGPTGPEPPPPPPLPPAEPVCVQDADCAGLGFTTPKCCQGIGNGGVCVVLNSDRRACGSCTNHCDDTEVCTNGVCVPPP